MGSSPTKLSHVELSPQGKAVLAKKKEALMNPFNGSGDMDFILDMKAEPANENIQKIYKVGKVLGEGHSSIVKKCCLVKDDRQKFAVKIVSNQDSSAKDMSYYVNELNILRKVEHPNIVRYYESFQDSKHYYHILEYCSGNSMTNYFSEGKRVGDVLLVRSLFYQAVSAIYYLHTHGICHRDVKLDNFLIKNKNDSRPTIKLIDFGFSKSYRKKRMRTYLGTTQYMSPEVIVDKDYGPEVDNWSLGVMLYIMLFGESPFGGETRLERVTQMKHREFKFAVDFENKHSHLIKIIRGLLEFNPENRMNLRTVLQSPWFEPQYEWSVAQGMRLLDKDLLYTLLIFEQKYQFQKVLRSLFVKLFLDDPELQKLTDIFRIVDLSEDGEISAQELAFFVQTIVGEEISYGEVKEVFSKINLKEGGTITYIQFICACASESFFKKQEYRRIIFDRIDHQGDGHITPEKLFVCFQRLGVVCEPEQVRAGLKDYDIYKDGKITFFLFNTMFDKQDARRPEEDDEYKNIYAKLNNFYSNVRKNSK